MIKTIEVVKKEITVCDICHRRSEGKTFLGWNKFENSIDGTVETTKVVMHSTTEEIPMEFDICSMCFRSRLKPWVELYRESKQY